MNLFQLFKSDSKEETSVETPMEQPLVEVVDIEKSEEKILTEPRKNDSAYTITIETVCMPYPENPEEVTWKATASYGSFEVIGVGKTLLKAKRNLHGQLKRMERFSRIASVLIGVRLGIYSCKVERKKEDGEISEEG